MNTQHYLVYCQHEYPGIPLCWILMGWSPCQDLLFADEDETWQEIAIFGDTGDVGERLCQKMSELL